MSMSSVPLPLPFTRKKATKPPEQSRAPIDDEDAEEPKYKPIDLKMVRRLAAWLAPYKWRYLSGITIGVGMILLQMTGPKFVSHLVDYTSSFVQGTLGPITHAQAIRHCGEIVLLWGLLIFISLLLERARILIMTGAGERVQFDLRRAMFNHLQRLSMSYYDRTKLGRIISRCTSDVSSLREVNVWGIDAIVLNLLMIVVAATALATQTSWRLFVSVCWLGPVLYVFNRMYLKRAGRMSQITREGFTRVSTNLAENITGVRVVTAFNRQSPNLEEFNRLQEINTDNNVAVARLNGLYQPALAVVGFTGKAIILAYGGYLVVTRPTAVTVGNVVEAFMYWDWFMNPILQLGVWYNNYMTAMAGGERVLDLLDTKPDVHDVADAAPLPRIEGHVLFENVTFGYNPQVPVLHDISFEAHPGQMVALVGATGSGKSSIISLIARFYQPQLGRVLVDGRDIRNVTGDSLHQQMGLVLQVNYLFTGTVMENIRYVKPNATEADVIAAAKAIGSHDLIMALQDGYQTEVG
jgi:ABC-type multidrug transport system fused ATPase/permease subunit